MNILQQTKSFILTLHRSTWILLLIAFLIGWIIHPDSTGSPASVMTDHSHETEAEWWTCSMHPQVKLPEAGQCPICFMDLIPMELSGDDENPRELHMSPAAIKLAEITTSKVRRGLAEAEIMLSGKVEYDEANIRTITTWMPGRIERLYVDFTGTRVQKGDHLFKIYSPELYSAQEELIQALKQFKSGSGEFGRESARITLAAAREKLSLLGLTPEQIAAVEEKGDPVDKLTIYSPLSGIVIHKDAQEGRYVKTGTPVYTIADLRRIWVVIDAYESDLPWIRFGQSVTFTTEAIPGKMFAGRVSFIDPTLNESTRTVKVRVNMKNPDGLLKPGMFVRARVSSKLDAKGKAISADLSGKWIGPMHPEIVKDEPGACDICGMDLVQAESLGIVHQPDTNEQPLLIPATAVLQTGKRALVYVRKPGTEEPVFESREVVLGPRSGDDYIIVAGLKVGEEIVTNGNFKIDSAMQIAAKPSMMSADDKNTNDHHEHSPSMDMSQMRIISNDNPALSRALGLIYDGYLIAQSALANDNFKEAKSALFALQIITSTAQEKGMQLSSSDDARWKQQLMELTQHTEHAQHWSTIGEIRNQFGAISDDIGHLLNTYDYPGADTLYTVFCPMAFDNAGANWVQKGKEVNNPYFGQKMLRCGEIKTTWEPMNEDSHHE